MLVRLPVVVISSYLPEKFHPKNIVALSETSVWEERDQERSFRAEWCEMYPWLHYDITLDAAFCHVCMTTSLTDREPLLKSSKHDRAFNTKGFTYWKDGTTAFKKHETSDCHREATEALLLPNQVLEDGGKLLSQTHREEKAANRRMFVMILQNITFLARHG